MRAEEATEFSYAVADSDPRAFPLTHEFVNSYAAHWLDSPRRRLIERCKAISMLHNETLLLLNFFARRARGPVLEIGPYIGGSAIAIASGLKEGGGGPLVTVEAGTSYESHPHLPTRDTVGDLQRNLQAFGVEDVVRIVRGWSVQRRTRREVRKAIAPGTVELFVVDADGFPGRDLWLFESLLAEGCALVFDDYASDAAPEKAGPVSYWVKKAIARGLVTDLGVYLWGTWVGQYHRPPFLQRIAIRLTEAVERMRFQGLQLRMLRLRLRKEYRA
jgi:predicted O-methyltransferase YrrM